MAFNSIRRFIPGAVLGALALFGFGAAGATSARAQVRIVRPPVVVVQRPFFGRPWWGWGWGPPYYSSYYYDPIAYQRELGFRDGFNKGKSDARHSRPDDPNSHKDYRNSSSITYRNAFLQGYEAAFKDQRQK
jgi:hypothetical protein